MKKIGRRTFLIGAAGLSLIGLTQKGIWARWMEDQEPEIMEADGEELEPTRKEEPILIDCDYILTNGKIIDGSGTPGYYGDLAIKDQKIVAIGEFEPGEKAQRIDATGLIVAPGFIDLHTHTENYLKAKGQGEMILLQGVTSQIGGNCGTSVGSISEYFAELQEVGINIGLFVGYRTLRNKYVGQERTNPTQLLAMQEELALGLEEGAFGLSVGLQYWPQSQGTTEEMIELCSVLRDYGGFYSTHMRNEEDRVLPSVEEAITIGMEAGVPVQYSHIKTAQKANWGKMSQVLAMVEEASQGGLDITADVYGYTFSSLDLDSDRESMDEEDLLMALTHPLVMVGSDSGLNKEGKAIHPRAYGNYPRILRKYVREENILPLEIAIHKMTAMPAQRLGLENRGLLSPGMQADITVFDENTITDQATRQNPSVLARGVHHVFVNGQLAVNHGEPTGILAGEPLKRS